MELLFLRNLTECTSMEFGYEIRRRRQALGMTLEQLADGRTKLVSTALFHTAAERDGMMHSGMEGGANQSYEALDRILVALG